MRELDAIVKQALEAAGVSCERFSLLELVRREVDDDGRALLVFVDGATDPSVFLKLGSGDRRRVTLEAEHRNLERLHRSSSVDLRGSVPRPLLRSGFGDFSVIALTALPGKRMKDFPPAAYFDSARFAGHFEAVLGWLRQLRNALPTEPPEGHLDGAVEVDEFRHNFTRSPALDRLLDASLTSLADRSPAPSCWHGDFCTANVLVTDDDAIRVIDWELPLDGGWPLADLLYFVSSVWCMPAGKGPVRREENFRRIFFESTPLADRLNDGIRRTAHEQDLDAELLLPLSVLVWTAYANRKRRALVDEGPIPEALASVHFPLVIVREGACRNLELLAELGERYRPAAAMS